MEHKCLSPWKGAVAGGLIAFAWSSIAWMALPFHNQSVRTFADPAAVVTALEANTRGSGVYIVPNDAKGQTAPTDPFVFLSFHKEGWGSMGLSCLAALGLQMIGGFYWTWILGKIPGLTLKDAALYGAMFGVCLGAMGAMPAWAWWKYPFMFSFLYVVDAVVSWTVASVVIAKWCQASVCALPARS